MANLRSCPRMTVASGTVVGISIRKNTQSHFVRLPPFLAAVAMLACVSGARSARAQTPQPPQAAAQKKTSTPEDEEVKRLREGALRGDAHAQFALGLMYEAGESVAQDNAEAV